VTRYEEQARTTEDIDVLVDARALDVLDGLLASHGFERSGESRLRHVTTGVRVDLLFAGAPLPRAGAGVYPAPESLSASVSDADVVGLVGLLDLKLRSRRHRDDADVVELLKRVGEGRYIELEASMAPAMRPRLSELRRNALDELAQE
jgi:hypothetical protein